MVVLSIFRMCTKMRWFALQCVFPKDLRRIGRLRGIHLLRIFLALFVLGGILAPSVGWGYRQTYTRKQTQHGQDMTFTFSKLPKAVGNISVEVTLYGWYGDSSTRYADVYANGQKQYTFTPTGQRPCSRTAKFIKTSTLTSSFVSSGTLKIRVDLSSRVPPCLNTTSYVSVKVDYKQNTPDLSMFT